MCLCARAARLYNHFIYISFAKFLFIWEDWVWVGTVF